MLFRSAQDAHATIVAIGANASSAPPTDQFGQAEDRLPGAAAIT
jgi:hypothetical protein